MADTLSKDQREASNPSYSAWVTASAGTGKTHVLKARVIRLLLEGADPARILCLTYTTAGTTEMATRIFEELGSWSKMNDMELTAHLSKAFGVKADEKVLTRARNLFAIVLDLPGGLQVKTIHSFCQSVLGRFPLEAGLPPRFQVADERTASEMMAEALNDVLVRARQSNDKNFQAAIRHIGEQLNQQDFAGLLSSVTARRGTFQSLIQQLEKEGDDRTALCKILALDDVHNNDDLLKKASHEIIPLIQDIEKLCKNLSSTNELKIQKVLGEILEALRENHLSPAHLEALEGSPLATWDKETKLLRLQKDMPTKGTREAFPDAERIMEDMVLWLGENLERKKRLDIVEHMLAVVKIAGDMLRTYQAMKHRQALLDYDDLIAHTERLFAQPGIAPWILYKLDGGIDHMLVDEAQDTSPVQWRLIQTLAAEFFAGMGAKEYTRTLFAVGDSKQSIFRFQGAVPGTFRQAEDWARTQLEHIEQPLKKVPLNRSYRSVPLILHYVDTVFNSDKTRTALGIKQSLKHTANRQGQPGLIELWESEKKSEEDEANAWDTPKMDSPQHSAVQKLAARITDRIKIMLDTGEPLSPHNRAIRPGDIMILVQNRKPFIDPIVRALKERNIPVAGTDRLILTDTLAVEDVMALADFALQPADDYTLAVVLKSPFINMTDDDLLALAPNRKKIPQTGRREILWSVLQKKAKKNTHYQKAVTYLQEVISLSNQMTPHAFFSHILFSKGGMRALTARLGQEIIEPLAEFLSLTLQFEATHTPSLQQFMHWVMAGKSEIKRDLQEAKNQVRIMTVHGAKGMEAPIVFLADTCRIPDDRKERLLVFSPEDQGSAIPLWKPRQEDMPLLLHEAYEEKRRDDFEENLRLLYVALTRAEDRLYIAGAENKDGAHKDAWYPLLKDAFINMKGVEKLEENGQTLWRVKDPGSGKAEIRKQYERETVGEFPLPDWVYKTPKPERAVPAVLAPSRLSEKDRVSQPTTTGRGQARQFGNLVHRLFEVLPDTNKKEWGNRLDTAAQHFAPDLASDKRQEALQTVKTVLDNPDYAFFFAKGSQAEVPVAGKFGNTIVSGQIDRVHITESTVYLLDFKSGQAPGSPTETPVSYLRQMAAYRDILAKIYPEKAIECHILWTALPRLDLLPPDILEQWRLNAP